MLATELGPWTMLATELGPWTMLVVELGLAAEFGPWTLVLAALGGLILGLILQLQRGRRLALVQLAAQHRLEASADSRWHARTPHEAHSVYEMRSRRNITRLSPIRVSARRFGSRRPPHHQAQSGASRRELLEDGKPRPLLGTAARVRVQQAADASSTGRLPRTVERGSLEIERWNLEIEQHRLHMLAPRIHAKGAAVLLAGVHGEALPAGHLAFPRDPSVVGAIFIGLQSRRRSLGASGRAGLQCGRLQHRRREQGEARLGCGRAETGAPTVPRHFIRERR